MDENQIEGAGKQPIVDIIKQYGSCEIVDDRWSYYDWNLEKTLARALVDLNTNAFLSLDILPSLYNTSNVVLQVRTRIKLPVN